MLPVPPAAGELVDGAGAVVFAEAEGCEDFVDAALVVPAVQPVHGLEQLRLAVDQLVQARVIGGIGGNGGVDSGEFGLDLLHVGEQAVQDLGNRGLAVQFGELGEVGHLGPQLDGNRSAVRGNLALDQFEDGGLAGSVLADQAHTVSGLKLEEGFAEYLGLFKTDVDVVQPDQAH